MHKNKIVKYQPTPDITNQILEKIIQRDYANSIDEVKIKLQQIIGDTQKGKNRISAAILKLADGKIGEIDNYIEMYKKDFRDVLVRAEYKLQFEKGFVDQNDEEQEKNYSSDWIDYHEWLNKD